jgi:CubicO group peptidase (beta-lactamase class C family)
VEAPDARLEARSLDPQKAEGLGVDDVEAASAVHEHLGEACVGDDGVNNEWIDPWVGDVVRVVVTVESDGHRGPIKEAGYCRLYREDLAPFSLALARREAGRGPSVDHEAVVDLGKFPVLVVTLRVLLLVLLGAGTPNVPA